MPLENLPEKCCGNCHLFVVHWFSDLNDPPEEISGICNWSEDKLPYAMRFANKERVGVYASDGQHCPCHEMGTPKQEVW